MMEVGRAGGGASLWTLELYFVLNEGVIREAEGEGSWEGRCVCGGVHLGHMRGPQRERTVGCLVHRTLALCGHTAPQ